MDQSPHTIAIEKAGGPAALGKALGCSSQAISQWKHIPVKRIVEVESLTGIPREDLRPDLYWRPKTHAAGIR
jgi:DNA-binding transcriptional regulator YdaS (Cro superfamily)